MTTTTAFVLGAVLGLVAAQFLINPSSCCNDIASMSRIVAGAELGPAAQSVGDFFGLWKYTPGAVHTFVGVN